MPHRSDRYLGILQAAVVAVALVAAVGWGVMSWRIAYADAVARAERNADLVREYALRLIQTQEILLDAAGAFIGPLEPGDYASRPVHDFLARVELAQPSTLGLGFIDPLGRFAVTSRSAWPEGDASSREYFRRIADGERLVIDRVLIQPGGQDALVIARRVGGDNFRGVLVSAIAVNALSDFLRRIAEPDGSSASLLGSDGLLLIRSALPNGPFRLGSDQPINAAIGASDTGVLELTAQTDGIRRIYAFERVGSLPVFAIYGVSKPALIGAWANQYALVLIALAVVATVSALAFHQTRRRFAAESAALRTEFDRRLLEEARKTAAAREAMLREMNHRIKNNLQAIRSLVRLKAKGPPDLLARDIVQRVSAISDIHDLLYSSRKPGQIGLDALLRRICENEGIFPPESNVRPVLDLEEISIGFDQATPIALVTVELVMNAVRHAFAGRTGGTVTVRLRAEDGFGLLEIADDGIGLPEGDGRNSGLRLVSAFVEQLGGGMEVLRGGGTTFRVRFPLVPPLDHGTAPQAPPPHTFGSPSAEPSPALPAGGPG